MPHATEPPAPDAEDTAFENVMRQMNGPFGGGDMSFDFLSRDLEPGEKADDAVDYEDFDDDELPEEEERTGPPAENGVEGPEDDADKGLFEAEDDLKTNKDTDTEEVLPGGITHHDLRVVCADWDVRDDFSIIDVEEAEVEGDVDMEDDWLLETLRPAKKRKLGRDPLETVALSHIYVPVIDDPQQGTSRISQKVTIDMNDTHILDERGAEAAAQKPKALGALKRDELDASVTKRLTSHYNNPNDQDPSLEGET
ncbi:hypothetical protein AnigIFM63604_004905 [Aspergillus niger]|uniref:Uncharacterized protein n=1 Tax=Aspergillus niger TaxID=5061 RepID=A0A9W6EEM4_ASPNG|nr:hypothetical protein AnigIFM63604_004905 [Aspergillus niger]